MTRTWPLNVVLSMAHGRLCCDMSDLYDIAQWMLDEPVWTLGLAAAQPHLSAHILAQRPDLADAAMPDGVAGGGARAISEWLDRMVAAYGAEVELEPLPPGTYSAGGFAGELERITATGKRVVVVDLGGDS